MNEFDDIREIIGFECIDYGQLSDENIELLEKFMDLVNDSYVLVQWPDSQELMEKDWFEEEAILETEGKFGSSTYFIPLKRMLESD